MSASIGFPPKEVQPEYTKGVATPQSADTEVLAKAAADATAKADAAKTSAVSIAATDATTKANNAQSAAIAAAALALSSKYSVQSKTTGTNSCALSQYIGGKGGSGVGSLPDTFPIHTAKTGEQIANLRLKAVNGDGSPRQFAVRRSLDNGASIAAFPDVPSDLLDATIPGDSVTLIASAAGQVNLNDGDMVYAQLIGPAGGVFSAISISFDILTPLQ